MGSPARELGKGVQCVRVTFIIANFVFLILGLAIFALGVVAVVAAQNYEDSETLTGENFTESGAILIVSGIVTIAVCVVGIIGAIALFRPLLIIFLVLMIIIFILEIASAILAFLYRDLISDELRNDFEDAVREYRVPNATDYEESTNDAVDEIQENLECCGATNWTIYLEDNEDYFCLRSHDVSELGPPESCLCNADSDDNCQMYTTSLCSNVGVVTDITFSAWTDGCVDELEDILETYGFIIGGVSLAIALIELLGIIVALSLCICITVSYMQEVV